MEIGAVWEVDNQDKRYTGKIPIFWVVVSKDAKCFKIEGHTNAAGSSMNSLSGTLYNVHEACIEGWGAKENNQIRLDMLAGNFGEPISGTNFFSGSRCGKSKVCGGHKCHCDISMIMTSGCQCGGC